MDASCYTTNVITIFNILLLLCLLGFIRKPLVAVSRSQGLLNLSHTVLEKAYNNVPVRFCAF